MFRCKKRTKIFLYIATAFITIELLYYYYSRSDFSNIDSNEVLARWYNYTPDSLNGPAVAMDNPQLLNKITKHFLIPPVDPANHPYSLSHANVKDPSMGQSDKVKSILDNKTNGFFIEVGALDGETRSNTLYFERYLNWTGLLIEPDPLNFAEMLRKNRRAWLSPCCVSINPYPEIVQFEQNKNMGKIVGTGVNNDKKESTSTVDVQCFPLYSYLLALNRTRIDYFSLDVEGAELAVLKTIPFQALDIQTLSVEFIHVPGGKDAISDFMFSQGYIVHSEVTHHDWLANDFIFMKV
ncbi:protein Star-like [Cimex lectularius]|uniref:Methyltransferase FkbM domain-containing protein n=1 Tax=Cimex lectularius TaxID=79782 RepID=A0A8I6SDD8_CIMLE|nr:protein Star-like [Cimex lectularius]